MARRRGVRVLLAGSPWSSCSHSAAVALLEPARVVPGAPSGDPLALTLADTGMPVQFTSFRNDGFAPDAPHGHGTFGYLPFDSYRAELARFLDALR